MKLALTPKFIDGKDCTNGGKSCADFFDIHTPGLCLRVTSGKKSWGLVYTPPGGTSRTRMALGTYLGEGRGMTLKAARDAARAAQELIGSGKDPRAVVVVEKAKTIAELIEERLAMELRGKKRRAADTEYRYKKYVIPLIGDVAVTAFKIDPHFNKVRDPILARGKVRMADMVYQDMNSLFKFAMQRGVIEFSQMDRVKRTAKYVPRERWLTTEEVQTLWGNVGEATRSGSVQQIIKLLLATGQRLQEVAGITRQEIDLKAGVWTLPAARAKNGCKHAIPLNALALHLLRIAMRDTNGKYLFPNKSGDGPRHSRDIDTTISYAQKHGGFGIDKWTPHDLRRTVATHMSKLGVPHMNISHVMNHITTTKATITQAVYDRHDYLPEKREALDKWGAFLAKLVGVETGLRVAA